MLKKNLIALVTAIVLCGQAAFAVLLSSDVFDIYLSSEGTHSSDFRETPDGLILPVSLTHPPKYLFTA